MSARKAQERRAGRIVAMAMRRVLRESKARKTPCDGIARFTMAETDGWFSVVAVALDGSRRVLGRPTSDPAELDRAYTFARAAIENARVDGTCCETHRQLKRAHDIEETLEAMDGIA